MTTITKGPGRRLVAALLTGAAVLAATGCVQMPEDGPVVESGSGGDLDEPRPIAIDPRPPQPGAPAVDIVEGFLQAMQATPVQTNAARQFLAEDAQAVWDPEAETITYDDYTPQGELEVSVTLSGGVRLDGRGSYRGRLAAQRTVEFPMTREDGEWRIARAPDALIVPEWWFAQRFRQVSIYFFDPTAGILVPEPVFAPRGDQLATALTSALLAGPEPGLRRVEQSFIPPGLTSGLSVPVSDAGVADLTLNGQAGRLTPQASELMLAQFAWTLRQEPSIETLRVTIDGEPVTLPGGISLFDVDDVGAAYDPSVLDASAFLYGLRDGLLVSGPPDGLAVVEGPMGTDEQGIRSVAVSLNATRAAGIARAGDRVLVASVRGPGGRVQEVVSGARNLLRPSWDFSDRLWLVDNARGGAVISHLEGTRPVPIDVPGISGRRVTHVTVSRDGSRLVAVVRRPGMDRLMVSRITHNGQGRAVTATPARRIAWEGESGLRVLDLAWNSPTSVAVLHRLAEDLSQVRILSVDGAPADLDGLLTTLPGRVLALAGSPAEAESLYAVTNTELMDLTRGSSASAQLDPRVGQIDYVG